MGTSAQGWGLPHPQAAQFGLARLCKRRGCSSLPPFFPTIYKKSHCCSLSLSNAGGSVNSRKGWRPQDAAPSSPGVLREKPMVLGSTFVPIRQQCIVCQRFEFVGAFFVFLFFFPMLVCWRGARPNSAKVRGVLLHTGTKRE